MESDERQQAAGATADELRRLLAWLERELDEGRLCGLAVGAVLKDKPGTRSFVVGFETVGPAPLAGAIKLLDATITSYLINVASAHRPI